MEERPIDLHDGLILIMKGLKEAEVDSSSVWFPYIKISIQVKILS